MKSDTDKPLDGWRLKLYTIIFEADTRLGRLFDQTLIAMILVSVGVVILDSVGSIQQRWGGLFDVLEWGFTLIFTAEYILRLLCVQRPQVYARSFFGIIDLLSILPSYLAILLPQALFFIDVRILRLLRVFRVFKLTGYMNEYNSLGRGADGQPSQDPGVSELRADGDAGDGDLDVRH